MSTGNSKAFIYLALFVGMTTFGLAPIIVRYGTDYSALNIAASRTVLAALILLPFWWTYIQKQKKKGEAVSPLTKWEILAGISLGIHFICFIGSLYYTSIASAAVLISVHPILLIVIERWFMKVHFSRPVWIGVITAFSGSLLLGFSDQSAGETFSNPLLGNALAFLGAMVFVGYFLIGKKVRQGSSWIEYVFKVYTFAGITCAAIFLIVEGPGAIVFEEDLILVSLALALGPQIIGHGSLNYAVKYISPTILATLILAEPLLSSVLGYTLFDEIPAELSMVAMAIILIGIALTWKKNKEEEA